MLTQEEKNLLLNLLRNAPISGRRENVLKALEMLASIEKKIDAMPVELAAAPKAKPKRHR